MFRCLPAGLCLAASAAILRAQTPPIAPSDLANSLTPQITSALGASGVPGVSVAVVRDGRLAFAQAFGMADLAAGRAASVETRYAVGSVSKQFTTAILLLLAEQGKLSLDDTVSRYFPDLTDASRVTIRQLLSHTSGYQDYAPQDYMIPAWTKPVTPLYILDHWARKPLDFEPGTRWEYSNTNYVLAGQIIEKVSGQRLMTLLRDYIFQPLGMSSAGDCSERRPGDAIAYTRYGLGPPRPALREATGWYFAAGELCMTPSDLARWDMAFLNQRILSPRSYEEFTREVRLNNGDHTNYALGLQIGSLDGIPTLTHGGEVSGFLASNWILRNRGGAVVVLSNQDASNLVSSLARQLAASVFLPPAERIQPADTQRARAFLEQLLQGKVDRAQITDNLSSYFTPEPLADIRRSLKALGRLQTVTGEIQRHRGGMTERIFTARFKRRAVTIVTYTTPEGKYEQFLISG
jgi:D-alanyl-D-alanine carboxypeptidase